MCRNIIPYGSKYMSHVDFEAQIIQIDLLWAIGNARDIGAVQKIIFLIAHVSEASSLLPALPLRMRFPQLFFLRARTAENGRFLHVDFPELQVP